MIDLTDCIVQIQLEAQRHIDSAHERRCKASAYRDAIRLLTLHGHETAAQVLRQERPEYE